VLAPVVGGSGSYQLAKARAEAAQAFEADQQADLCDREVGRPQQILGTFDLPARDVGARRLAIRLCERSGEVELREVGRPRERVEIDRFGKVPIGQVACAAERDE